MYVICIVINLQYMGKKMRLTSSKSPFRARAGLYCGDYCSNIAPAGPSRSIQCFHNRRRREQNVTTTRYCRHFCTYPLQKTSQFHPDCCSCCTCDVVSCCKPCFCASFARHLRRVKHLLSKSFVSLVHHGERRSTSIMSTSRINGSLVSLRAKRVKSGRREPHSALTFFI